MKIRDLAEYIFRVLAVGFFFREMAASKENFQNV